MSLSPTDNSPSNNTIIPTTTFDGGSKNVITVDTEKLIEALDTLPEAMMKLEKLQRSRNDDKDDDNLEIPSPSSVSPPTSRRFSCHGGINNSFGMDGLLAQDPEESMAFKARKIMGTLVRSKPKEVPRPIGETASTVLKKLSRYAGGENALGMLYAPYDIDRSGKITYDSFVKSLIASSARVTGAEIDSLLGTLDPKRTGTLSYNEIAPILKSKSKSSSNDTPIKSDAREKTHTSPTSVVDLEHVEASPPTPLNELQFHRYKRREVNGRKEDVKSLMSPRKREERHEAMAAPLSVFTAAANSTSSPTWKPPLRHAQAIKDIIGTNASPKSDASSPITTRALTVPKSTSSQLSPVCKVVSAPSSSSKKSDLVSEGILESSVCVQLGGRLNVLRHFMKRGDISRSGLVNRDEFRVALLKAGVNASAKQYSQLFDAHSIRLGPKNTVCLTDGKAVNIDSFLQTLSSRITSPVFNHLSTFTRPDRLKLTEEMRVLKKYLKTTGDQENSHGLFRELDPANTGWVDEDSLKKGLNTLGTDLSDKEFETVLKRAHRKSDGSVDIKQLDRDIHKEVKFQNKLEVTEKLQRIVDSPRVSNNIISSEVLYHDGHDNYHVMTESQDYRREESKWGRIRNMLQDKKVEVLKVFGAEENLSKSAKINRRNSKLRSLHQAKMSFPKSGPKEFEISELKEKLYDAGVILGQEDTQRLMRRINTEILDDVRANAPKTLSEASIQNEGGVVTPSPKVKLGDFCNMAGIIVSEDHRNHIYPHTANEPRTEEGVFLSSRHSVLSKPNFATTYDISSSDFTPGFRKKKIPSNYDSLPHKTQPSKFWELQHGTADLFPVDLSVDKANKAEHSIIDIVKQKRKGVNKAMPLRETLEMSVNKWGGQSVKSFIESSPQKIMTRVESILTAASDTTSPQPTTLRRHVGTPRNNSSSTPKVVAPYGTGGNMA